jgi:hypothetical protein
MGEEKATDLSVFELDAGGWLAKATESGKIRRDAEWRWQTALGVGNGAALLATASVLTKHPFDGWDMIPSAWFFLIGVLLSAELLRREARYWHYLVLHQGTFAQSPGAQRDLMLAFRDWKAAALWRRPKGEMLRPKDPFLRGYSGLDSTVVVIRIVQTAAGLCFTFGLGYPLVLLTLRAFGAFGAL